MQRIPTKESAIHLVIPRLPLSPNSLRGRHWSAKHRDLLDWKTRILCALAPGQRRKRAERKRRFVHVALFSPYTSLDPDNLHGSIKPILDALKAHRLIYDDSEEWLEYSVSQKHVKTVRELRTEIRVVTDETGDSEGM
jgi:Holliday junction resolvase RusA-like endonuclease